MKTMLHVPFAEKDEARRLGARWDVARKAWFIENVEDVRPFMRWMPDHFKKPIVTKHAKPRKEAR
jgi:hypothetical protein